jgi:hypothetical protein
MPVYQKKKKKKGKNSSFNNHNINRIKNLEKYLVKSKNGIEKKNLEKNKDIDINIELYNPLKELYVKKVEEENKKKMKPNINSPVKFSSITSINFLSHKKNQAQSIQKQSQPLPLASAEPNFKNDYTQTEEIFFRMHLSFFVGKFIILTGRRNNNNNNIFPNISTLPINSGKMKNNYINPFSHSTLKRNDLLVNVKYKNTNWIKFGNIFVDEKNINRNYIIKEILILFI